MTKEIQKAKPSPGTTPAKPAAKGASDLHVRPLQPKLKIGADDHAVYARALRRKRLRRIATQFGIGVLLPTLVVVVYFAFLASDIYVSTSMFMVKSSQSKPSIGLDTLILGGVSGSNAQDSLAVREYILSRDMLARLDKDHAFLSHYKQHSADWWSRLGDNESFEDAHEYYLDMITAEYDTLSGSLLVEVKAYTAKDAQMFAKAILSYSEEAVNKLSERVRLDQIGFAKAEVEKGEQRLVAAQNSLMQLQEEHEEFHPGQYAETILAVTGGLEAEKAAAQAELAQARAVMKSSAPRVMALKRRVASLSQQIKGETRRLVGSDKKGLNTSIIEFEMAGLEKVFAEEEYASTMAALEIAKMEAARKSLYVVTISKPSLPDEATKPEKLLSMITAFFVCLAIFGIGSLFIAAIREHARI